MSLPRIREICARHLRSPTWYPEPLHFPTDVPVGRQMWLNVGCGRDVRDGWVNVDREPGPGVQVVANLDEGLPMVRDGEADYVLASQVLDHVLDFDAVMREFRRVLRPGGVLEAVVPYGFNTNPEHRRYFDKRTVRLLVQRTDGTSLERDYGAWSLVHYQVRRVLVPWLDKPRVGFDPFPWIVRKDLSFALRREGG